MSDAQNNRSGIDGSSSLLSNEQLATPALSPIVEHGTTKNFAGPHDLASNGNTTNVYESRPKGSSSVTANGTGKENRKMSSNGGLASPTPSTSESSKVLKLSPRQIEELTNSPGSLPLRSISPVPDDLSTLPAAAVSAQITPQSRTGVFSPSSDSREAVSPTYADISDSTPALASIRVTPGAATARPNHGPRSASTPSVKRRESTAALRNPKPGNEGLRSRRPSLAPIKVVDSSQRDGAAGRHSPVTDNEPSPMPSIIPLPPLSLPTYLQLELSAERPSALYIHRPVSSDFPYESSKVKFERLLNFLYLPPHLERALLFGALACLDAWLFTFTILPLRFIKAVALLVRWWIATLIREAIDIGRFVYSGTPRVWQRHRQGSLVAEPPPSVSETEPLVRPSIELPLSSPSDVASPVPNASQQARRSRKPGFASRHRRSKSVPSALLPNHKADILHGLLIIISCMIMVRLDASRMYHSIRGQAAIKLYVIYNVLEVGDRLFSALGQDILECLFSKETLERKPNGRSKIIRPIWMFIIALIYNVIHATMLFYQVVTLNVAVNSYSNALLTLLMSNQFVEIKGTVFKKFEKENLFQMTCADVVERFQLWLMLLIIALRNIIEVGGLSISLSITSPVTPTTSAFPNATSGSTSPSSIVPHAFTLISNFSGQVLSPFFIVLGSEMLVDWVKHAYINKFNSVSPRIYSRFLDVLAKDYYSHAFADQNLTKRLGLPVLPLSCLFIRAAVQTYHMFVATHMPAPLPSAKTALSTEATAAPTAALAQLDGILRRALGKSSFGAGGESTGLFSWSVDDAIALGTMVLFFLVLYLVLLLCKLVLGMILLSFARGRYRGMKERERESYDTHGKRVGGWGVVEVDDEKRRWIYDGDEEGLRKLRDREQRDREKRGKEEVLKLDGVGRYMMAAKRIW